VEFEFVPNRKVVPFYLFCHPKKFGYYWSKEREDLSIYNVFLGEKKLENLNPMGPTYHVACHMLTLCTLGPTYLPHIAPTSAWPPVPPAIDFLPLHATPPPFLGYKSPSPFLSPISPSTPTKAEPSAAATIHQ
jgi:hypothetical protein